MVPFTVIGPDIVPRTGISAYELPSIVKEIGSAFSCMSYSTYFGSSVMRPPPVTCDSGAPVPSS